MEITVYVEPLLAAIFTLAALSLLCAVVVHWSLAEDRERDERRGAGERRYGAER